MRRAQERARIVAGAWRTVVLEQTATLRMACARRQTLPMRMSFTVANDWLARRSESRLQRPTLNECDYPHTRSAVSTTKSSLCRCSYHVRKLPGAVEAKPHWGLIARYSSG